MKNTFLCESCGEVFPLDEVIWVDDMPYCEKCGTEAEEMGMRDYEWQMEEQADRIREHNSLEV